MNSLEYKEEQRKSYSSHVAYSPHILLLRTMQSRFSKKKRNKLKILFLQSFVKTLTFVSFSFYERAKWNFVRLNLNSLLC